MAGRFCSHRGHRRQLRRHHRLDLRGRHLKRLREQRHELGGVGPHAAEALQVSLELGEVLGAHRRRDGAERYEDVVVVTGDRRDLVGLHDRLEAVHHPLARRRLTGQTKRERGDHKREPDYEHGPTAACGSS
jgi:hypothetical protein